MNVSGGEPSYTWYRGPTVQTLSGPSADEWIRRFLKVGVKEKTPVEGEEETEEEEQALITWLIKSRSRD